MDEVTSPHGRPDQIVTRFLMSKFIESVTSENLILNETRKFINKLLNLCRSNIPLHETRVIEKSKPTLTELTDSENHSLFSAGYKVINNVLAFKTIRVNGIQYSCTSENKLKYCNSIVYCKNHGFGEITKIVNFDFDGQVIRGFFMNKLTIIRSAFGIQYIKLVKLSDTVIFGKLTQEFMPAIKISNGNCTYALKLANCWETD